jgi:hypothetical protein
MKYVPDYSTNVHKQICIITLREYARAFGTIHAYDELPMHMPPMHHYVISHWFVRC